MSRAIVLPAAVHVGLRWSNTANPMTGFSMAEATLRGAESTHSRSTTPAWRTKTTCPCWNGGTHSSATIRQLAQSILDEAMRHPDRLEKLPATMQERIRRLQHRDDDHDLGSPGGSTARDALVPEASGGIPKPVPASATVVRTVQKKYLKKHIRTGHQPKSRHRGRMCPSASGNRHRISSRFSPLVSGLCPLEQRHAVLAEGTCAANWVARTTPSPTLRIDQEGRGRRLQALERHRKSTCSRHPCRPSATASMARCPPSPSPSRQAAKPASREVAQRHLDRDQAHAEDTIAARRADHRLHG